VVQFDDGDRNIMTSLLPPNATPAEQAIEATISRVGAVSVQVSDLWNPATCPATLLPWLAWGLSVDEWDETWTEATKRAMIAASVGLHRQKGTIASIRRALQAAGLGDAALIERAGRKFYNGMLTHDGAADHAEPDHWAEYRVVLMRPLSIAQGLMARRIIEASAPVRCRLKTLDFTDVPNLENGAIRHDGSFTYGAV
jgi:phage tail P2-like protein